MAGWIDAWENGYMGRQAGRQEGKCGKNRRECKEAQELETVWHLGAESARWQVWNRNESPDRLAFPTESACLSP